MSAGYLIAGLGNPGLRYRNTRHNLGFMVIDEWVRSLPGSLKKRVYQSKIIQCTLDEHNLLLVKPQTYMNRSGDAIGDIMAHYKISTENLLVIYDDVDLDFGQIRIRGKGSSGGHNGLESIIQELGTPSFARMRLGIGSAKAKKDMIKFVLSRFDRQERKQLKHFYKSAQQAAHSFIIHGLEKTMNEFNTRQKAKSNQEVST